MVQLRYDPHYIFIRTHKTYNKKTIDSQLDMSDIKFSLNLYEFQKLIVLTQIKKNVKQFH